MIAPQTIAYYETCLRREDFNDDAVDCIVDAVLALQERLTPKAFAAYLAEIITNSERRRRKNLAQALRRDAAE